MENKGLIIIIVGLIFSIVPYGIFIGIPLIILGTYLLNKKVNNPTEDIEKQIKNKQEKLENINHKYEKLSEEKEKELNNEIKEKQDNLNNLNEKYTNLEQEKQESFDKNLKTRQEQLRNLDNQIKQKIKELKLVNEETDLVDLGLYTPQYDFLTSIEFKDKLDELRKKQKQEAKNKTAAVCDTELIVNGDKRQGKAMTNANINQILKNFNLECDVIIDKVKTSNIENSTKKIQKAFKSLNKLNERNKVRITQTYLNLKLDELNIAYEYQLKKEEEKEILREEREKQKEEAKIQKKLDKEKNKYMKENEKIDTDITRKTETLEKTTSNMEKEKLKQEIEELKQALQNNNQEIENIETKKQETGAGYVYIISNIGSFGKDVYKIGVTRRDEPQERINELSNASVPFKYDTHAFIFSDDAYELEKNLHTKFDDKRVNKVNKRKEFFNINMDEVKQIVEKHKTEVHSFNETSEAQEYHDSKKIEKQQT